MIAIPLTKPILEHNSFMDIGLQAIPGLTSLVAYLVCPKSRAPRSGLSTRESTSRPTMMKRIFALAILCVVTAASQGTNGPATAQQTLDWASIFQDAVVHDSAINDRARDRMFNEIMPKLLNGEASLTAAEVPRIVEQLNRKEDGIRLQASALFVVLAQFRQDSAVVLSSALPALNDHVHDSFPRVRTNSLNAVCHLNPVIPTEELQFLIRLMNDPDESLANRAVLGIARTTSSRPEATDAIERALSRSDSPGRRLAAIQAVGATHVTDSRVVEMLGNLLTERDRNTVRTALISIRQLGIRAITPNLPQLTRLAETSDDKELATLAQQIVDEQNYKH